MDGKTFSWCSQIEHPDVWLLPIRPEDVDAERDAGVRTATCAAPDERPSVDVATGNGDMSEPTTAASLPDRIDAVIRWLGRGVRERTKK